jgi:hypothetical protein
MGMTAVCVGFDFTSLYQDIPFIKLTTKTAKQSVAV